MMGSLLLRMTYGINPKTVDHPFIVLGEGTIHVAATAGSPGAFLVDIFPSRTVLFNCHLSLIRNLHFRAS